MKNEILEFFELLKKEHRCLLKSIIVSFVLALIPFIYCSYNCFGKNIFNYLFLFFIPFVAIVVISFIATKFMPKFPKITKFISAFFISIIMLFVQIFIAFCLSLVITLFDGDKSYNKPSQYKTAIKHVHSKSRIQHFPKELPNDAINIQLNFDENNWFGSEEIIVKFKIDKNYINNELNNYKFISVEKPNEYVHDFNILSTYNNPISIENFTFYVINDKSHEHPDIHMFPYHYGIGVNENTSEIIYYYVCPD